MSAVKTNFYRNRLERGKTRLNWLESYHTFSFGDYFDPRFHQFGDLRVINDDIVQPEGGFSTHGHQDMEIITVVLQGTLEHKDSLGNGSIIQPGDVQRMTAGTGVLHSEFNPSTTEAVRLLQIWIHPEAKNLQPGYEQRTFPLADRQGRFQLLASRDGRDGSVTVHQDVALYAATLGQDQTLEFALQPSRQYWLQVATGTVEKQGEILETGDAYGIMQTDTPLRLTGVEPDSQVLLFDLKAT